MVAHLLQSFCSFYIISVYPFRYLVNRNIVTGDPHRNRLDINRETTHQAVKDRVTLQREEDDTEGGW